MVAGLAFLSKKSFNPSNLSNQKSVWEAEQESKKEQQRLREREKQLRIERDHEELARIRDGSKGGDMATLRFMYDAPPGLDTKKNGNGNEDDGFEKLGVGRKKENDGFGMGSSAGDDDAAAAFRQMFASSNNNDDGDMNNNDHQHQSSATTNYNDSITETSALILSGSTFDANAENNDNSKTKTGLTQLEKAVGKRPTNQSNGLSYEEQIARFPQLKNAPMAMKRKADGGEDVMDTNVTFKPLGVQIRNVRCLACGIWGHSRGDRECKMSGWDPFASTASSRGEICAPTTTTTSAASSNKIASGSSIMPPPKKKQLDESDDEYYKNKRDRKKRRKRSYSESDESDDERDRHHRKRKKKSSSRHHKEKKRRKKEKRRHYSDDESNHDDDRSYHSYGGGGDDDDDSRSYSSYEEEKRRRRRRKHHKKSSRSSKKDDHHDDHDRKRSSSKRSHKKRSYSYDSSRSR